MNLESFQNFEYYIGKCIMVMIQVDSIGGRTQRICSRPTRPPEMFCDECKHSHAVMIRQAVEAYRRSNIFLETGIWITPNGTEN